LPDMISFVRANLGLVKTELADSMKVARRPRRPTPSGQIGLAWRTAKSGTQYHDGGTAGFAVFLTVVPDRKFGVIVLCNTAAVHNGSVEKLAIALLRLLKGKDYKLNLPKPVTVPTKTLEKYVGTYTSTKAPAMKVSVHDGKLKAAVKGQLTSRLYALSPTRFSFRTAPAAVEFIEENGKIVRLVAYGAGTQTSFEKTE